ncbi:MAG: hypothetical protein JWM68_4218 [Verrucomicrobiales bacterium]|nr:hypothetical protein [Verrucomicrobiales bacterium]
MARHPGNPLRRTSFKHFHFLLKHFITARICSILLLLVFCTSAHALRFDVFVGFNGAVPEGNWFPITCEVQNDGPSFNGIIEVSAGGGGQARRVPLELTTGATKRVIIPSFSSSRYSTWTARLLNERGKPISEQNIGRENVKNIAWGTPLVASLSRSVGGAPILPIPKNKNQPEQNPIVTRMQATFFPDNPIALEGLGTLYLNSEVALDLKMPQVQALLAWIDGGGHLVLGVEQAGDVNATPWLKGLLPCELNSTAEVKPGQDFSDLLRQTVKDASTSQETTIVKSSKKNTAKAKTSVSDSSNPSIVADPTFDAATLPIVTATAREGEILLSVDSHPLIIQTPRGRGRVTVLAFSPEREPFLSWKNRGAFWAQIAQIPGRFFESTDYNNYNAGTVDGILGAMVDSKQVRKLPLAWLLLLLLVYLVIIGPFDRWWLKKINRQMLTWITFPTYVLCFSALIYFIGFKLRAGDSEWNEIHVVDVLPQGEKSVLRGRTFASIYSPSNARYNIASDQPFATFRGEYSANNYGNGQENSQADVIQRGNSFAAEVSVPVWTSQLYISDWLQSGEDPVVLETSVTGTNLQVTVQNKLDRALKSINLIFDGRVYSIGDVPSGQKKLSFDTSRGTLFRDFVRSNGSGLREATQQRHNTFGDNRTTIPNIALGTMAASFTSQLNDSGNAYQNFSSPTGMDLSRWAERGDTILLAWDADHSYTKPLNQFSPRRLHRDTLLRWIIPKHS